MPKRPHRGSEPGTTDAARTKPDEQATAHWFASQFATASHTLWCIAFSITNNRTLAEDVVQESAAIALTKLDEFTPGTNFGAWLGKIVRYVALNHARRAHRDSGPTSESGVLDRLPANRAGEDGGESCSVVTGRGELRIDQGSFDDRVTHALSTLEATARACLLLRTLLNMPYREIAAALDIPEGTAMSHVHRARQTLRELLSDDSSARESKGRDEL